MTKRFTNANNVYLTRELFFETATNRDNVVYTLKREDHEGYESLYQHYINTLDPTEYTFATRWLAGWEHWQAIANASWFQPIVQKWRHELEVKIRSQALAAIVDKSMDQSSREGFAAAKYIADGWGDKTKRGRPSKKEIKENADEIVRNQNRHNEDLLRIIGGNE